jgi:thioredoxin 1
MKELTQATYAPAVSGNGVAVVKFWRHGCVPCEQVSPVLEELAGEFPSVSFLQINGEENLQLCAELNVRYFPTLLVYKDGKLVEGVAGARTREFITGRLQEHL